MTSSCCTSADTTQRRACTTCTAMSRSGGSTGVRLYRAVDQVDPVARWTGDFRVMRGGNHSTQPNQRSGQSCGDSAVRQEPLDSAPSWCRASCLARVCYPFAAAVTATVGGRQEAPADLGSGSGTGSSGSPRVTRGRCGSISRGLSGLQSSQPLSGCGQLSERGLVPSGARPRRTGAKISHRRQSSAVRRGRVVAGVETWTRPTGTTMPGPVGGRAGNDLSFQRSVGGSHLGAIWLR